VRRWSRAYPEPMAVDAAWLTNHIRDIPDYPQAGVTFRDLTPLMGDAEAFRFAIDAIADHFAGVPVDRVLGIEARGFIVGAPVAYRMGASFVPARKAGKLPWAVAREAFILEYGNDILEIHRDGVLPGERILIVDDVLATGGTASAAVRLVEGLGGEVVGLGFVIELVVLGGRAKLGERDIMALLSV
jgi:adenine phosphoribosyltransferase